MSGPGGSTTKRDQRRDARRQQLQQRQLIRERERQRKIRNQRLRLAAFIGVPILLVALISVLLVATHQGPSPASSTGLSPASGQTVDGMQCTSSEQLVFHIHSYLEIYVDGKPVTVPPGAGIVAPEGSGETALASNGLKTCIYPLHVHDTEPNIIHIESPIQKTYTLGNFFDIWGQPLSATEMMGNKADSTHKLVFEVFDASGKLTQVTSDPRAIGLAEHETIVILYNSPNVQPKPFTNWTQYGV
ncbi:MAG TPA: hypothetical protein VFW17_08215 [Ktedonobacterales bacterium]|nr:hypothetical protein [Ktedonobacterales bacterium]